MGTQPDAPEAVALAKWVLSRIQDTPDGMVSLPPAAVSELEERLSALGSDPKLVPIALELVRLANYLKQEAASEPAGVALLKVVATTTTVLRMLVAPGSSEAEAFEVLDKFHAFLGEPRTVAQEKPEGETIPAGPGLRHQLQKKS